MRFADPAWLRQLSIGGIVLMVAKILFFLWTLTRLLLVLRWRMRFSIDVIACAVQAANVTGWWIISTPDPSGLGEAEYGRSRRLARFASIVGLATTLLWQVEHTLLLPPDLDHILVLAILSMTIVPVVGDAARYNFLAGLARRVPNDALARRGRMLRIASPTIAGLYLALSCLYWGMAIAGTNMPTGRITYGCSEFLLLVAEMILTLVTFSFIQELRDKIVSQGRVAARFWAAHES